MNHKLIFLAVLLTSILGIRFTFFLNEKQYKLGDTLKGDFTIFTIPSVSYGSQKMYLNISNGQKILLQTDPLPQYSYGDKISVEGQISEQTIQNRKILKLAYPSVKLVNDTRNPILAFIISVRQKIEVFFSSTLDNISSGLMLGIVFGIKGNFPSNFSEYIKNVGLLHIIAASGMNVTLLAGFVIFTLELLFRRKIALVLTLILIAGYAVLSGLSASIVRAAIMGGMGISAQVLGRQNRAIWSLILTAFVMLFISPSLILDVGFQLSFMATAGILLIKPVLDRKIGIRGVSGDLNTTLAAQIGTLPIMALTFGTFSIISLPVNLLVLWTIPILMVIGALASIVYFISPQLASIILYLSMPFMLYLKLVIERFGQIPALLDLSSLPAIFFVGYYLILLALISFKRNENNS